MIITLSHHDCHHYPRHHHHYHQHHQYENASSDLLILKAEIMPHSGISDQLEKWLWLKEKNN